MSTCSNCYNGCTEIVSDRCVKYTGIDVPVLGIKTGDSLSFVEQALITFLTSTLDGTGVIIDLSGINVCTLVNKYLPTCKDLSIADISKALIQAACDLQVQVTANTNAITALNADYTIGCLTGVTASSDTHIIVQAVINKLCTVVTDLADLTTELHTMYSSNGTQLNNYISSFLASQPSTNSASARMVPYCPIAYYGPLSGYPTATDRLSLTGQGIGYWTKVYLCNGATPGVPDLRGRVIVGTTVMGNNAFPPQTDPCGSCTTCANPLYQLGTVAGSNCVTLTTPQLPNHTHSNTAVATTPPHSHFIANPTTATAISSLTATNYVNYDYDKNRSYTLQGSSQVASIGKTSDATQVITVTMTNAGAGSGDAHPNIQPVMALHYIMYIP
jgi:microcystin-dependent protein